MMDFEGEELTKIVVDLYDETFEISGEGLWVKPLGDDLYEIRNSPWHNTEINYLDIVRAVAPNEDKKPVFVEVYKRSGHRTIQIYILKAGEEDQKKILHHLEEKGATWEQAFERLYALDIPPNADFDVIANYLQELQKNDVLEARYASQPQPRGTGDMLP